MSDAGPGLVFTGTMRPPPEGVTYCRPLLERERHLADAFGRMADEINRAARELNAGLRRLIGGVGVSLGEGGYIVSLTKREGVQ